MLYVVHLLGTLYMTVGTAEWINRSRAALREYVEQGHPFGLPNTIAEVRKCRVLGQLEGDEADAEVLRRRFSVTFYGEPAEEPPPLTGWFEPLLGLSWDQPSDFGVWLKECTTPYDGTDAALMQVRGPDRKARKAKAAREIKASHGLGGRLARRRG
jgi:hypothetical protein